MTLVDSLWPVSYPQFLQLVRARTSEDLFISEKVYSTLMEILDRGRQSLKNKKIPHKSIIRRYLLDEDGSLISQIIWVNLPSISKVEKLIQILFYDIIEKMVRYDIHHLNLLDLYLFIYYTDRPLAILGKFLPPSALFLDLSDERRREFDKLLLEKKIYSQNQYTTRCLYFLNQLLLTKWIPLFEIPSIETPSFLENDKDLFLYKVSHLLRLKDEEDLLLFLKNDERALELREYLNL